MVVKAELKASPAGPVNLKNKIVPYFLFYEQNEYIWEEQRHHNRGPANYSKPKASPKRQREGQLAQSDVRRKLGRVVMNKSSLRKSKRSCQCLPGCGQWSVPCSGRGGEDFPFFFFFS